MKNQRPDDVNSLVAKIGSFNYKKGTFQASGSTVPQHKLTDERLYNGRMAISNTTHKLTQSLKNDECDETLSLNYESYVPQHSSRTHFMARPWRRRRRSLLCLETLKLTKRRL